MENPLKVFWRGKLLRDVYPHATTWQVIKFYTVHRLIRKLFIVSGILVILATTSIIYSRLNPAIVYTKAEVIKEVDTPAPIMDRIADCESGARTPTGRAVKGSARHYAKSGQVLMTGNDNHSVDVGKYAINSVWFSKATEMNLDITREADNKTMAYWIYKNRGTQDWYPSFNCWK
tara:strand:- start:141 stop:665 length:525 start_codon:yes stop_codon:yes gene_type:complete